MLSSPKSDVTCKPSPMVLARHLGVFTLCLALGMGLGCDKKKTDSGQDTEDDKTSENTKKEKDPSKGRASNKGKPGANNTPEADPRQPRKPQLAPPRFPAPPRVATRPSGKKIKLRLKLKKGQIVKVRTLNDQKIRQTIRGRKQNTHQIIGMGTTFNVKEVDTKGNSTIQVTYHWIKFQQSGGPQKIAYDSDNPPATLHQSVKMFAALKGKGFTLKLTPLGKVLDIKGAGKMLEDALKEAKLPPGRNTAMIKKNLQRQFSDKALKRSMENLFAIYPEQPVGVGSHWKMKNQGSGAFPMILYNTYTVTKLDKKKTTLNVVSVISTAQGGATMTMGAATMKYTMRGTQKGTIQIARKTGFTTHATMTQAITGTITMNMGPGKQLTWPITINSKVKVYPEPSK